MSPRHYRPPTKPLVTAWARHLDRVMRARDLSQTNVFDAVRVALGYGPNSRSAVHRVFSDRDPSEELAAELTRLYGAPEPEAEPTVARRDPSLEERAVIAAEAQVVATREQTEAMRQSGLVAALTEALQAQTQALTDIRLELAQAARDAEEQREATAELLGHLSAQLRTLAGNGAGSAAQGSVPQ